MKAAGILAILIVFASPLVVAGYECPKLQAQVDKEYGRRFDRTASTVRATAKQALLAHKAGKDAESKKLCEEAAKAAGMKLGEMQ